MREVDGFNSTVAIKLTNIRGNIPFGGGIPSEALSAHIQFLQAGEVADTGEVGNTYVLVGGHSP